MSLERYTNGRSMTETSSMGIMPSNRKAAKRMLQQAELAAFEIILRERVVGVANQRIAGLYENVVGVFGREREAFEDIVTGTREGDCQRDTAAFAARMLQNMAADLERNTRGGAGNMITSASRSFEPVRPRSSFQRLLGG